MMAELKIEAASPMDVQVERHLCRQISTGSLAEGQRLPPTFEMARQWGVNHMAVQKAMARLTAGGWLERAPRRGTFVRRTVEKAVIGVVMGPSLADETAHFYRAALRAIQNEMQEHQWACRFYDGLTGPDGLPHPLSSPIYQNFSGDLRNYSFKGLIEFAPGVKDLAVLKDCAHLARARWGHPGNTDCAFDFYRFAKESVEFLARHGRRRIACLSTVWHLHRTEDIDGFRDAARELHLPEPQIESIPLTRQGFQMEREIHRKALSLFQEWQSRKDGRGWPDALLITDDIAMRAVALALLQSGIKAPDSLTVVSLANEGVDLHYAVPVVRYEFSSRELARQLIDLLWKRIMGEPLPPLQVIIPGRIKEVAA